VTMGKRKGRVVIEFQDIDDLKRISSVLDARYGSDEA